MDGYMDCPDDRGHLQAVGTDDPSMPILPAAWTGWLRSAPSWCSTCIPTTIAARQNCGTGLAGGETPSRVWSGGTRVHVVKPSGGAMVSQTVAVVGMLMPIALALGGITLLLFVMARLEDSVPSAQRLASTGPPARQPIPTVDGKSRPHRVVAQPTEAVSFLGAREPFPTARAAPSPVRRRTGW